MNELALFAGAGGGILGGRLLGWRTVCGVEIEPGARAKLIARQNDGCLRPFPIWDDVRTFDGRPWRGIVDVVSGGFPCQDISAAGLGAGITGERSGLWTEQARIIREVRPRFAFVENSPVLTSRGLGVVLGDLASLGYDAGWGVLGADDAGAPHRRKRIWILAHAKWDQQSREEPCRREAGRVGRVIESVPWDRTPECALREFRRVDDGLAGGVDRTDAIRNGQVPAVVRLAWSILSNPIHTQPHHPMTPKEQEQEDKQIRHHVAAARVCFLANEKADLQRIHTALSEQCKAIRARLCAIESIIRAEKASVNQ